MSLDMSQPPLESQVVSSTAAAERLPKRDYIILPLLSLMTILVMFVASEVCTHIFWPARPEDPCLVLDPVMGNRHKSNCTARSKIAEGPWTTSVYNECGYLSATSCKTKPTGAVRIVILGSSIGMGIRVPYEQTFFALASSRLSRTCNRAIDVQNLSVEGLYTIFSLRRLKEAIELKPDVVLFILSPGDFAEGIAPQALAELNNPAPSPPRMSVKQIVLTRLKRMSLESRSVLVAQHFLMQNKDVIVRLHLAYGDKIEQPRAPGWQQHFADFDRVVGDMADQLRSAGVPLIFVSVPSRPQAAMFGSQQLPPYVDPFAFGHEIDQIAARHGAGYVDISEVFGHIPDPENLFYVVDGHPTADGQKVIAQYIEQKLQDGSVAAFSHCALAQNAERGN
jgi:hypothetical protein